VYISCNYRNKSTLKEIADAVYLSSSYFSNIHPAFRKAGDIIND
jgi:hypothetical protein